MRFRLIIIACCISFISKGQTGFTLNLSIPVFDSIQLTLPWAGGLNFAQLSEINLNDDSVPDLFVFDRSNNRVETFINTGSAGTACWQYAPQYAAQFPELRSWAFLYDYNCDGKKDLFTVHYMNSGITQYRNDSQNGNIIFTLVDSLIKYTNVGPTPVNILASGYLVPDFNDVDGDGDMDIIGQQFQCVGGFAYYKNMSMEHYGVCDSLNDYEEDHGIWGEFTLRAGAYKNITVNSFNVTCFVYSPVHEENPFPYEIARRDDTYANIMTIDIDGDDDMDALIGDSQADNSLLVYNGGTNTHAHMDAQDTLFPSYNVPVHLHSFPAHSYVDADNDGVKDLVVTCSEWQNKNSVFLYHNTGTTSSPVFSHVRNNFLQDEMIDVGECAAPVLYDFDSDGLLDLVIGNRFRTITDTSYVSGLTLYRNTGTTSSPAFTFVTDDYAGLQAMNITGQLYPAFGDMDADGDIDMMLGIDDGKLMYFANTAGPGVTPVYASPVSNYMSIDVGQANTPQLIDLNRDALLDLVVGGKNGLIKYYQNLGTATIPFFSNNATIDTLGGIVVSSFNTPDGFSVPFVFEQGGNYRMLVSNMKGDIYLYGNIDGNLNGNFNLMSTVLTKTAGSRYGYNLSVSGGDLNNDTLVDMVAGYFGGGLQIFYQDDPTSSISHAQLESIFTIHPNPSSGKFEISSTKNFQGKYLLYDMTGRRMLMNVLNGEKTFVDVSALSYGIYILHIQTEKGEITTKVVIQ